MAQARAILNVGGTPTVVFTHNLNDANAVIICVCGGWPGRPYVSAQDANTATITFGVQGTGTLHVEANT